MATPNPSISPAEASARCSASCVIDHTDVTPTSEFTYFKATATAGGRWHFVEWRWTSYSNDGTSTVRSDHSSDHNPLSDNIGLTEGFYEVGGQRFTFWVEDLVAVFVNVYGQGHILCNASGEILCNYGGSILHDGRA